MASAVFTVLWPEEFTVYDFRVCEQLEKAIGGECRVFKRIAGWVNSDRLAGTMTEEEATEMLTAIEEDRTSTG